MPNAKIVESDHQAKLKLFVFIVSYLTIDHLHRKQVLFISHRLILSYFDEFFVICQQHSTVHLIFCTLILYYYIFLFPLSFFYLFCFFLQRFTNEDHLSVHKHKHEMTLKFGPARTDSVIIAGNEITICISIC